MGGGILRKAFPKIAGAASLLWLSTAQGIAINDTCPDPWQTILVNGFPSAPYTNGAGGKLFICYNPADDCYVAKTTGELNYTVPFTAKMIGGGGLAINSINYPLMCGGVPNTTEKTFKAKLEQNPPDGGCLNKLSFSEGAFTGGMLVDGPAVLIEGEHMGILFDALINPPDSLNIPFYHGPMFTLHIPLVDGGIVVSNKATKKIIAGGSLNDTCGAQLVGPIGPPIPTVPQYGLMLLAIGLLFSAVRMTRRQMSA